MTSVFVFFFLAFSSSALQVHESGEYYVIMFNGIECTARSEKGKAAAAMWYQWQNISGYFL